MDRRGCERGGRPAGAGPLETARRLPRVGALGRAVHAGNEEEAMAKGDGAKKEVKKKAAKTIKEKRAEKKSKRQTKES